jgi:hypothetical protein
MRLNSLNITENDEFRGVDSDHISHFAQTGEIYPSKTFFDGLSLRMKIVFVILAVIIFFLCVGLGIQGGKNFNLASRLKQFADDEDFLHEFNYFIGVYNKNYTNGEEMESR